MSYPDDQGADVYSGKYESWECAGAPGAYKATFTFTYTYANGTGGWCGDAGDAGKGARWPALALACTRRSRCPSPGGRCPPTRTPAVEGPYKACEYGVASVERGYTKWAHSTEACPDAWDQLEYTTLLDSYALEPNPCGEPAANEDPAAALDAAAGADGTVAAEEVAAARRRRR